MQYEEQLDLQEYFWLLTMCLTAAQKIKRGEEIATQNV